MTEHLHHVHLFTEDIDRTIAWWRAGDYEPDQVILAQGNVAQQLAVFGGLSVVGSDYDLQALGVRADILRKKHRLGARARAGRGDGEVGCVTAVAGRLTRSTRRT